jgi:Adenosine-deaminase (editase) domain
MSQKINKILPSPDDIASCAIKHFESLPNHGKPKENEWTVYAALVASSSSSSFDVQSHRVIPMNEDPSVFVVCSATGSKCTTAGPEGWCLRDLHAEVLVKRGFQRLLWKEIRNGPLRLLSKVASRKSECTSSTSDSSGDDCQYELRQDIKLHLYVSDSPCGDATIYKLQNGQWNFTGAKVVLPSQNSLCNSYTFNISSISSPEILTCCDNKTKVIREPNEQLLGQLRVKSGRSNLSSSSPSTSLSCSDKILKWTLVGLQGSQLPIRRPIYLHSIVVSFDPRAESKEAQTGAIKRAICDRRQQVYNELKEKVKNEKLNEKKEEIVEFLRQLDLLPQMTVEITPLALECSKSQRESSTHLSNALVEVQESSTHSGISNENGKRQTTQQFLGSCTQKRCKTMKTLPSESNGEGSLIHKTSSPCGYCINWQNSGEGVEILVGNRGIKQGKRKGLTDTEYIKRASRLCRREMCRVAGAPTGLTYRECKEHAFPQSYNRLLGEPSQLPLNWYKTIEAAVMSTHPLEGWVRSENRDFTL